MRSDPIEIMTRFSSGFAMYTCSGYRSEFQVRTRAESYASHFSTVRNLAGAAMCAIDVVDDLVHSEGLRNAFRLD